MKVGMVLECGPLGADLQVCEYLAKQVNPDISIESVTLDNKQNLIEECGHSTASLLELGCERVIIVWDLCPPWSREAQCLKEDRKQILKSLQDAGIDPRIVESKVGLLCIKEELEAWLLVDKRAILKVLKQYCSKAKVKHQPNPEYNRLKKRLNNIFYDNIGRKYDDRDHAIQIVKSMKNLKKLKKIGSFSRFARMVANE